MKFHQRTPLRHLGDLPSMGAERYGEKTAMHHQEDELSYAELEATANRIANGLVDAGVEPGDRVAIEFLGVRDPEPPEGHGERILTDLVVGAGFGAMMAAREPWKNRCTMRPTCRISYSITSCAGGRAWCWTIRPSPVTSGQVRCR